MKFDCQGSIEFVNTKKSGHTIVIIIIVVIFAIVFAIMISIAIFCRYYRRRVKNRQKKAYPVDPYSMQRGSIYLD